MSDRTDLAPTDVVHRIYAALVTADFDAVMQLTSPGITVVQDSALPWGGRHVGHEALGEFFLALVTHLDSHIEHHAMFDAGNAVIQYGRTSGTVRSTGEFFDVPECHIWRVQAGRANEANFFIDSTSMLTTLHRHGDHSVSSPPCLGSSTTRPAASGQGRAATTRRDPADRSELPS